MRVLLAVAALASLAHEAAAGGRAVQVGPGIEVNTPNSGTGTACRASKICLYGNSTDGKLYYRQADNTLVGPLGTGGGGGSVVGLSAAYNGGALAADQTMLIQSGKGGPAIFKANGSGTGTLLNVVNFNGTVPFLTLTDNGVNSIGGVSSQEFDIQMGNSNVVRIFNGVQWHTPLATSGNGSNVFQFTVPAHTAQASLEIPGFKYDATTNTRQWATGNFATQREFLITAPTYAFVGSSTITDGATLAISGPPVAGTNATITNKFPVMIDNDGIGTTVSVGAALVNATAAGAGAQQVSPSLYMRAQGWKTNATAASQTVEEWNYLRPVQGAANPTFEFVQVANVNGGTARELLKTFCGTGAATPNNDCGATTSSTYTILQNINVHGGVGLYSPGGSGRVNVNDDNGTSLAWGSSTLSTGGSGWSTTSSGSIGFSVTSTSNYTASQYTVQGFVTANARGYWGGFTGAQDVMGDGNDYKADTAGTTANRLVCVTASNKVATCAASAALKTVVGMAITTASSGTWTPILNRGDMFAEYDVAPAFGDILCSSGTTGGRVATCNTPAAGTAVGVALEAGGTTIAGKVAMHFDKM